MGRAQPCAPGHIGSCPVSQSWSLPLCLAAAAGSIVTTGFAYGGCGFLLLMPRACVDPRTDLLSGTGYRATMRLWLLDGAVVVAALPCFRATSVPLLVVVDGGASEPLRLVDSGMPTNEARPCVVEISSQFHAGTRFPRCHLLSRRHSDAGRSLGPLLVVFRLVDDHG